MKTDLRLEKYLKTEDNWHGNWEGNKVQASLDYCGPDFKVIRFGCWGNDDYGLVLDLPSEMYAAAKEFFEQLPEPLSQDWLKERGFLES